MNRSSRRWFCSLLLASLTFAALPAITQAGGTSDVIDDGADWATGNGVYLDVTLNGVATGHLAHFDERSGVFVESPVVFSGIEGDIPIDDYAIDASLLCRLLGGRVIEATRDSQGGLILRFDGGNALHVLNDGPNFESFQVRLPGQFYVA